MTESTTTDSRTAWRPGLGTIWAVVLLVIEVTTVSRNWGPPLQPLLSVVFVLTFPGAFVVDLRGTTDLASRFLLAIAGSLAFNVAVVSIWLLPNAVWLIPVGLATLWSLQRHLKARLERADSDPLTS